LSLGVVAKTVGERKKKGKKNENENKHMHWYCSECEKKVQLSNGENGTICVCPDVPRPKIAA
jgi:hypothetical protein